MALKFFYGAENSLTLSGTDYSSGDTTGTNTATTFAAGAAKTGSYGVSSAASTLTHIAFTATDIWPSAATPANSAGAVGCWVKVPTGELNNSTDCILRCIGSTGSDRLGFGGVSSNAIAFECENVTNGVVRVSTAANTVPAAAWRFVVGRWDIPNGKLAIEVYSDAGGGTLVMEDADESTGLALSTTYLPTTAFATLQIAYHTAEPDPYYTDHFLISDVYSAQLQNNAFITDDAAYVESSLAIISVADNAPLYDGMAVAVVGGGFGASQGASTVKIKTADNTPSVTQTAATWADDLITFTAETTALPFGALNVEVVVGGTTVLKAVTLASAPGYANSVANVPWPAGAVSVFDGASAAVVDNDLYEYETLTDQSVSVEVFPDGTFLINSSTGTHEFDVRVYDQTDEAWSAWATAAVSAADSITGTNSVRTVYSLPSVTGLRKWVDYIPVKVVTPTAVNTGTFNDAGGLVTVGLTSITGLVAWVDYIPVFVVTDPVAGRWRYDDLGWVPITAV